MLSNLLQRAFYPSPFLLPIKSSTVDDGVDDYDENDGSSTDYNNDDD